MNKRSRLATGDKVEIIDGNSPHFGKTGVFMGSISGRMIVDPSSKPIKTKPSDPHWKVKLDDTGTIETFTVDQFRKIQ